MITTPTIVIEWLDGADTDIALPAYETAGRGWCGRACELCSQRARRRHHRGGRSSTDPLRVSDGNPCRI